MATETFLALEVSEQKVRHIVLEKKGKDLVVKRTGGSIVEVGPSAPGALALFVKEVISLQNLKVSRIFLTVNRRDTVIHQLNLPKTSSKDLELIVSGEIEKIPGFSDNEFDYIYREQDAGNKNRTKVTFAAASDELLKYLLKELHDARIPCRELEIAPLNFVGLLSHYEFLTGAQAFIIMGDHVTHFIIFETREMKFLYTTNTGKETLFPSYMQNKLDRMAAGSWAEELKRVLKSYLLEHKDETIGKVWFIWDQENAVFFDEFLRKDLNLNVEMMTLDKLPFLQKESLEEFNPVYLLGCVPAIYYAGKLKPTFSLSHFFRTAQIQNYLSKVVVASAIFIGAVGFVLGGMLLHFHQAELQAGRNFDQVQAEIEQLAKESQELFRERDEYVAVRAQLLAQATYVKLLNRMSWSEVLSVVASELPQELSLTSFKVNESATVNFTGEAFRMESVAAMLRKVDNSAILERGKFSYLTEQEVDKKKIFRFGILANVKLGETP